jgi:deoxyribodipyrimidine photo-lyase
MSSAAIVWFRLDLRVEDNPALQAAVARGGPVVPVFVWAPGEEAPWEPGAASCWWLHQSLRTLEERLGHLGSRLIIRRGPTLAALQAVMEETGAEAVFWNRRYEPAVLARDTKIKESFRAAGRQAESFNGSLLREPWEIQNKSGRPFQVFTPFWRASLGLGEPAEPWPAPRHLKAPGRWPSWLPLEALGLEPRIDWAAGLRAAWQPGSAGASAQLKRFLREGLLGYDEGRNIPERVGTSRLSPHLHFGEISPRQVWQAVKRFAESKAVPAKTWRHWQFLTELGWREFAHHLLYHFPHTPLNRCGANSPGSRGGTSRAGCGLGSGGARVTRGSMPGCGSCGPPAGCTTVSGWWWRRFW